MSYGICSGLSAITGGRLVKCIPQFVIVYVTGILSFSVILFMLFWKREPSYFVPFITIPILGMTEGIWHSTPPSKPRICGIIIYNLYNMWHPFFLNMSAVGLTLFYYY